MASASAASCRLRSIAGDDDPAVPADRFQGDNGPLSRQLGDPATAVDRTPAVGSARSSCACGSRPRSTSLPPVQQTVVTLRDVEGLSADEVCDLLELSPGNQRVILHRARARVREALEDYMAEEAG